MAKHKKASKAAGVIEVRYCDYWLSHGKDHCDACCAVEVPCHTCKPADPT
jgi:hypothetical protein